MSKTIFIGMLLTIPALLIDGLTGLLGLGFIVGDAALGLIPVVGPTIVAAIAPIQTGFGYVFSLAIGIGGGVMLITLLIYNQMFYAGLAFGIFFAEAIPFIGILPGWTALAVRSTYKKWKSEKMLRVQTAANDNQPGAVTNNIPTPSEQPYEITRAA